jgi:Ser/Thr protein kinase RdoA (MazF antagonist)
MDEKDILQQIQTLVEREHQLRSDAQEGEIAQSEERSQLRQLEEALDQCWDLLRQRRAHEDFHQDPDEASARPVSQVEGYVQ